MITSSCVVNVSAVQEPNIYTSSADNVNSKYDSFIIKYKKNNTRTRSVTITDINGAVLEDMSDNVYVVDFEEKISLEEAKKKFNSNSVEYIQPNYSLELESADDGDSVIDAGKNENTLVEEDVINIENTGNDVVVAVIDSDIDINNTAIKDYLIETDFGLESNKNSYDTETDIVDRNTDMIHGTHVAGIIAGKSSATSNIYNTNIKIMPLNVFENGSATTSDIVSAIEYAKENGAKIINMSFGSTDYNIALKEAIENAPDVLFVCAAGNFRRNMDEVPVYPASFDLPNIISVTSVNADKGLSYYSDYAVQNIDIAALGRNISSTAPGNVKVEKNGTSMAAAVVTNAACAVYADGVLTKPEEIKECLVNGADKVSSLNGYVNKSALLNLRDSLAYLTKEDIETIVYDDEFTDAEEKMSYDESMRLFNASPIRDISAGGEHVLVLKEDGTVWAWGRGTEGQLGNGFFENRSAPVKVKGLEDVVRIAAGGYHSMAVDSNGKLYTWGASDYSQLGIGTNKDRCIPMQVDFSMVVGGSSSTYVMEIDAGLRHSVLKAANSAFVFGANNKGQLGNPRWGDEKQRPGLVPGIGGNTYRDVESVSAGGNQTFILAQSDMPPDEIMNEYYISLFVTGEIKDSRITQFEEIDHFEEKGTINSGYTHAYYVEDNVVPESTWVLGNNEYGEMGTTTARPSGSLHSHKYFVVSDNPANTYKSVECGNHFTVGLRTDGSLDIWGLQINDAAFFDGSTPYSYEPIGMNISNVADVSCGLNFVVALTTDGKIYTAGVNECGQLGNGTTENSSAFVQVLGTGDSFNANIIGVAAGANHCLALKSDGTVWAWGKNDKGQLGDGTTTSKSNPVIVNDLSNIKQVSAGGDFSMALDFDGNVYLWGSNEYGQLGITSSSSEGVVNVNGSATMAVLPVKLNLEKTVKEISAGNGHAMAVDTDKNVWVWGKNDKGQLGNRTTVNNAVPQKVTLTYLENVAAGYDHSLVLKQDTTLYSFGSNTFGQLGNIRSETYNLKPISVKTEIEGIEAGSYQSYAWDIDGKVYACGYNVWNNLATGSNQNLYSFTEIPGLSDIKKVAAGEGAAFAINDYGQLFFWGDKEDFPFDMGVSIPENSAVLSIDIGEVEDVAVSNDFAVIVKKDQTVWTVGSNNYGQLGTGDKISRSQFTPVVWTDDQSLYPAEGNGTAANPYKIYTKEDYFKISNKLSACYRLMNDIDFGGAEIASIGPNSMGFSGTFEGNNHRLSNFKINTGYLDYSGIFGYTRGATIKDLSVFGVDVSGCTYAGVIIGYMNDGTLSNCSIMYCTSKDNSGNKTKIVGFNSGGSIVNCINNGDVFQVQSASKTIDVSTEGIYKYTLTAANVPYSDMMLFSITYDESLLKVKSLGLHLDEVDGEMVVADDNIRIVSNKDGVIEFYVTRVKEKNWSGVVANIEFEGIGQGQTQIKFNTM